MKCSIQNSVGIFIPGVFYILYLLRFVFYIFCVLPVSYL